MRDIRPQKRRSGNRTVFSSRRDENGEGFADRESDSRSSGGRRARVKQKTALTGAGRTSVNKKYREALGGAKVSMAKVAIPDDTVAFGQKRGRRATQEKKAAGLFKQKNKNTRRMQDHLQRPAGVSSKIDRKVQRGSDGVVGLKKSGRAGAQTKKRFTLKPQKKAHDTRAGRRSSRKKVSTPRLRGHERMYLLLFLALVLVVFVAATIVFLPKAEVSLDLKTAPLLIDEVVRVSVSGDTSADLIPGTSFFREVEVRGNVPSTGLEQIGSKATGTVTLVNNTESEQRIKERSRLETTDGVLFYMQKAAFVRPNASVRIEIEAAEAGEQGNLEKERLSFVALDSSAQTILFVESESGEVAGGSGEEVSVISQADEETARKSALIQAQQETETAIRAELPEGWAILEESWAPEIRAMELSAEVGETAPVLEYTARVAVRVLGYEQANLDASLRSALERQLDESYMLFPGPISFAPTVQKVDWEAGEATLSVRVTHSTIPQLSLETLRAKLVGRSLSEAQHYLEGLPGVASARLSTWPFWVRSIPRIDKRISLDLASDVQP